MSRGGNAASALLDALMPNRHLTPAAAQAVAATKVEKDWKDNDVCRLYLCGLCPHDLFINSKHDLHPCRLKHIDSCRTAFEAEPPAVRLPVERAWISFAEDRVIRPCDRRVEEGKKRCAVSNTPMHVPSTGPVTPEEIKKFSDHPDVKATDIKANEINQNMLVLQLQVDEMKKNLPAPPAAVSDATTTTDAAAPAAPPALPPQVIELQKMIDTMNTEKVGLEAKKIELIKTLRNVAPVIAASTTTPASALQKNMMTCEICASLLRVDETEERMADHRSGKVHASFAQVREKAKELQDRHKKWLAEGVVTEASIVRSERGGYDRSGPPPSASSSSGAPPSSSGRPYDSRYDSRGGGDRYDGYRGRYADVPPRGGYNNGYNRDYRDYDRPRDDRRYEPSYHSSSSSSHRSSSHRDRDSSRRSSRSRSRSHSRDRHSSSKKHHRSSRHHSRSPSSSRSRSRSRSRDRKSSHHKSSRRHSSRSHSRSRSRSRDRKHHKSSHKSDKKSPSRSRSKSKQTNGATPATTTTTAAPMQTDTFSAPLL